MKGIVLFPVWRLAPVKIRTSDDLLNILQREFQFSEKKDLLQGLQRRFDANLVSEKSAHQSDFSLFYLIFLLFPLRDTLPKMLPGRRVSAEPSPGLSPYS